MLGGSRLIYIIILMNVFIDDMFCVFLFLFYMKDQGVFFNPCYERNKEQKHLLI